MFKYPHAAYMYISSKGYLTITHDIIANDIIVMLHSYTDIKDDI